MKNIFSGIGKLLGNNKSSQNATRIYMNFTNISHIIARIRIFVKQDNKKSIVFANEGDNLMSVMMPNVNQDLHLFGICNKELACTSCSVHVITKAECLKQPKEGEYDILFGLNEYREGATRMSCQIIVTKEMNGKYITQIIIFFQFFIQDMEVEIASANKFL